jgi:hypothetical protein
MGEPQVMPGNISDIQNRIIGNFTLRDIGVAMVSLALPAAFFSFIFDLTGNFILGFIPAIILGAFFISIGFMHMFSDMEPVEKWIVSWFHFKSSPKEFIWKKEIIDMNGYYASDSTQSFFQFNINPDGILLYHNDQGGAALLKIEGVDYQLLSGGERDVVISTFGDFLDSLNFPIQLLIKTTPLDLRNQIFDAKKYIEQNQQYERLQQASMDYAAFLEGYQESNWIYNKSMYIILPYTQKSEDAGNQSLGLVNTASAENIRTKNPINKMMGKSGEDSLDLSALRTKEFSKEFTTKVLSDRIQVVSQFISSMPGISCIKASLPEYVELFYYFFNINESNIKSILAKNPSDNLASSVSGYKEMKERANKIKQGQKEQQQYENIDDILG